MRELRFGIIGAGFWARFQLAGWQELDGAKCVAICDVDRQKAEALAARASGAAVYTSADSMLTQETLDFVDIITSPETHKSLVELAARHKTAAICQKPLAESPDDAQSMADVCRSAGVPLLVHENFRWQHPLRELKRILGEDTIGDVFRARIHFCSSFPVFGNQPLLAELDRFMLIDVGTHILDVARLLFGEAMSVYCVTQRINPAIKGEDVATVILKTRSGATVINEMSYASRTRQERFPQTYVYVEGRRGSVELVQDYWIHVTTETGTHSRRCPPPSHSWADPAYDLVHASIVDCNRNLLRGLADGEGAETTAEDNLKTLQLVFASYESAEQNRVVRIEKRSKHGVSS